MRVNTDDALKLTTTNASEQLRDSLTNGNIAVQQHHRRPSPTDVPRRRRAAGPRRGSSGPRPTKSPRPTFDRNPLPGGAYEFTMKPNIERDLREQAVDQTMQTIDRRVNELGVTEPSIARQPQSDEILVQMPGVTRRRAREGNHGQDRRSSSSSSSKRARRVEGRPAQAVQRHAAGRHGNAAAARPERGAADAGTCLYVVKKIAPVTGQDLRLRQAGRSTRTTSRPSTSS